MELIRSLSASTLQTFVKIRLPDPGVKLAIPHAIGVRGIGVIDRYEHCALLRHRVHRADCRAVGAEELIIPGVAMEDRNECCLA